MASLKEVEASDGAGNMAPPPAENASAGEANIEVFSSSETTPDVKEDVHTTQEQLKNNAIQHLLALKGTGVSEDHARILFDRYDSKRNGVWDTEDTRLFLFDLFETFGRTRTVPDEAVDAVVSELQLNADSHGITWIEFKSYMIYLQNTPLDALVACTSKVFPTFGQENSLGTDNAVIVTGLPKGIEKEAVTARFKDCADAPDGIVVFLAARPEAEFEEALICFSSAYAVPKALALSGQTMLNCTVEVEELAQNRFPSFSKLRKPGKVARLTARVVVSAQEFDEKHQISAKVAVAKAKVAAKLEEHKVQERLRAAGQKVSGKAHEVDEKYKLSEKAREIDGKYKVSEKASAAKAAAVATAQQVMANEHVQRAAGWLGDIVSQVTTAAGEFQAETQAAIAAEQTKSRAAGSLSAEAAGNNFKMQQNPDKQ